MKKFMFCFAFLLSSLRVEAVPHIVVIQVDDLPRFELEVGFAYSLYPNIAALQASGVDFKKFFITNPICTPSRATFLTGQYSANHNVHCNVASCTGGIAGGITALDHSNTLPVWLQAAGYRTGVFGKYINENTGAPKAGWTTWQTLIDPYTYYSYNYQMNVDGAVVAYGSSAADHQTQVLTDRAVAWITANKTEAPLFVYLTPVAVHSTFDYTLCAPTGAYIDTWCFLNLPDLRKVGTTAWSTIASMPFYPGGVGYPAFNEANISDKPSTLNWMPSLTSGNVTNAGKQFRARMHALLSIDDMVGQVKTAFGSNDLVIFFMSDNGQMQGWHRRGDKQVAFDPSTFIHLVVSGAGVIHLVSEHLILSNDLAPTIVALAGATAGLTMDGRSFVPILQGQSPSWRKRAKVEHWQNPGTLLDVPKFVGVRTSAIDVLPSRLYVEWPETSECELYNGITDVPQNVNTCASNPTDAASLASLLSPLKTCAGSTCVSAEN